MRIKMIIISILVTINDNKNGADVLNFGSFGNRNNENNNAFDFGTGFDNNKLQ